MYQWKAEDKNHAKFENSDQYGFCFFILFHYYFIFRYANIDNLVGVYFHLRTHLQKLFWKEKKNKIKFKLKDETRVVGIQY